jgi:hypothetical protein
MKNIIKYIFRPLKLNNLRNFLIDFVESFNRLCKIRKIYTIKPYNRIRISVKDNTFNKYIQLQSTARFGVINKSIFVTTLFPDLNVVINRANPYVPLLSKSKENWLIHIEPPGYINKLGYNSEKYLSKFTRVYTSDPKLYNKGGKFIASPPFVHWHLEISSYNLGKKELKYDYDFLKAQVDPPRKQVDLVAINSNINDLEGHIKRTNFVRGLCEINFDFLLYGGSNWSKYKQYVNSASEGKWPIYSISRYVLVIENEVAPFYWTEKITDTILCWSMPIYYGCTNIEDYLPEGSFIRLNIDDVDAFAKLNDIIKSQYYEENIENLAKARDLILDKFNLLSFIDSEFDSVK